MADGSNTTITDALATEALQILQDMSAVISRQAHLVEKLALMQRDEPKTRLNAQNEFQGVPVAEAVEAASNLENTLRKGGYTHGKRKSPVEAPLVREAVPHDQEDWKNPVRPLGGQRADQDEESQANAVAEAEGTSTAQPPEAETVSRVAPGRTGDGAVEAGAAPSMASDAGSQADEAAGGVTVGGDESGTAATESAPAPRRRKKDVVLDRYAEHGEEARDLAQACETTAGAISVHLSEARRALDPRVAQGDAKRLERRGPDQRLNTRRPGEEIGTQLPRQVNAYRAATQPKTLEPHADDIGKPLCRIDTKTQIVDGPDDEVALRGPWLKVVAMMADQRRFTIEELLPMSGAENQRAFDAALKRANLALAKTGLTIHDCEGMGLYQLRKLL